jgi:hypothetical protein
MNFAQLTCFWTPFTFNISKHCFRAIATFFQIFCHTKLRQHLFSCAFLLLLLHSSMLRVCCYILMLSIVTVLHLSYSSYMFKLTSVQWYITNELRILNRQSPPLRCLSLAPFFPTLFVVWWTRERRSGKGDHISDPSTAPETSNLHIISEVSNSL